MAWGAAHIDRSNQGLIHHDRHCHKNAHSGTTTECVKCGWAIGADTGSRDRDCVASKGCADFVHMSQCLPNFGGAGDYIAVGIKKPVACQCPRLCRIGNARQLCCDCLIDRVSRRFHLCGIRARRQNRGAVDRKRRKNRIVQRYSPPIRRLQACGIRVKLRIGGRHDSGLRQQTLFGLLNQLIVVKPKQNEPGNGQA